MNLHNIAWYDRHSLGWRSGNDCTSKTVQFRLIHRLDYELFLLSYIGRALSPNHLTDDIPKMLIGLRWYRQNINYTSLQKVQRSKGGMRSRAILYQAHISCNNHFRVGAPLNTDKQTIQISKHVVSKVRFGSTFR